MNYIGIRVEHKSFGEGTIISQENSASTLIKVRFTGTGEEKVFSAPMCFENFLKLLSNEKSTMIQEALEQDREAKFEETQARYRENEERKARLKIQRTSKERPANFIAAPTYSTIDSFCDDQKALLQEEIEELRKNGGKRQKIYDGKILEKRGSWFVYSFETDLELDLPGDTEISLWLRDEPISGSVISCEEFSILIASSEDLGRQVSEIEFSAEPWRLTEYLIERLEELKMNSSPLVHSLLFEGRKKFVIWKTVNRGQEKALKMSLDQPITFIWGPPGTGKTETLARIAIEHMSRGERILMLSYSNVSVDGAIWRVFHKAPGSKPGTILRYGYAKDQKLLEHEYLTTYNYVLRNHAELEQERVKLTEEKKHYPTSSAMRVRINKRLQEIRETVTSEEKSAVWNAPFVATTVSKATADSAIYEHPFDTVIFDEASMAYIPQVIFSAGLAKKHFICLGDFSQLPPIVQSSNTSRLNLDIFRYCGIVDAVEREIGHEWLCLLDIQYRMHPQIASFAGEIMYHDLLQSSSDMREKTAMIVQGSPLPGEPMQMMDLSGLLSVCKSTADHSRMNVLSAFFSMMLAVEAAKGYEVGIITPYNAQSRLLHAMSRDISESNKNLKKITCATVHQFQGSEKDIIIFDAVDCYRSLYPGRMITSMTNDYANRLFNVALTRAKGKMITVVNNEYMKNKGLPQGLMFKAFLDACVKHRAYENIINQDSKQSILHMTTDNGLDEKYWEDLLNAKKEILIDIPGLMDSASDYATRISQLVTEAKKHKIRVIIRAENKGLLPDNIREIAVNNEYVYNPVTMIDREIIWFGEPHSLADFVTEGKKIPIISRPVIRFAGKYTARALYGFLEMNQTIDRSMNKISGQTSGFANYVNRKLRCEQCGAALQMKISKKGAFFLSCSGYPKCRFVKYIEADIVQEYLDLNGGKKCPVDQTMLKVKQGNRGVRIYCCNVEERHFFKLDEI